MEEKEYSWLDPPNGESTQEKGSEGEVLTEVNRLDCEASENQWRTLKEGGIEWEAGTMSLTP